MPPKSSRGTRGGDPYRASQRRRRAQGLPAQDIGDRRPPEPSGPPPGREEGRPRSPLRTVTTSVRRVPRRGEPFERCASSEPPRPIAAPPATPSGRAPGIPLDPSARGWAPGWVFVGTSSVSAELPPPPSAPPAGVAEPASPPVTETSQTRVVTKRAVRKSPRKARQAEPAPLFAPKGDSSGSGGACPVRERSRSPLVRKIKSSWAPKKASTEE